jgi:hypothetical protein
VGFSPNTPQKEAGRTTDPAVCVPSATGTMPSATAAAEPLDDPPGVLRGSSGLTVLPGAEGRELGGHGLAEDDRTGPAQSRHALGVRVGRWPAWMGEP